MSGGSPAADRLCSGLGKEVSAMALFLFLIIAAIGLGIAGAVVKGLFYLLIIGILVFLVDLVFGGIRIGRRRGTRPAR